jgi:hypothetical protein
MNGAGPAILLALWLISSCCVAQSAVSLPAPLAHAIETRKQTLGEAQKYTYTEVAHNINYDKQGKVTLDVSETYEIIFLEGAPYKKHVLHNGQLLPEKDAHAEEKKMDEVARTRKQGGKDRHGVLHPFNSSFQFSLPLDELAVRFDVAAAGQEELGGKQTLVFTAAPRPEDEAGLKQAAHEGMAYKMKLWVDQQESVFRRIEAEVVAVGMRYDKGTVVSYDWKKINNEAWLPVRYSFKGKVRYMMSDVPAEAEFTFSDYKKFRTDSKITAE